MSALILEGRLERAQFGGPVLVLRGDDGQSWQLEGDIASALVGRRIRIHGAEAPAQFGFAMVGPVVDVHAVEPID